MPEIYKESDFADNPQVFTESNFADTQSSLPKEQTPSIMGMAGQAIGQTLKSDVPYLAPAVQYMRDLPFQAQEKMTEAGYPRVGTALGMAAMPASIAAEFLPKTGGQLALQGFAGPVLKGAGAIAKRIGPSIISTIDQIAPPITKRAFERTEQVYEKLKSVANTEVIPETIKSIKEAIKLARHNVGQRLGMVEDEIAAQMPGRSIATHDLGQKLEQDLANKGFDISGQTGDVSRGLVRSITGTESPVQSGMTRLYRGESIGPTDPLTQPPKFVGRWFTTDRQYAELLSKSSGGAGKLKYADIPTEELPRYSVKNYPEAYKASIEAGGSILAEKEFILPGTTSIQTGDVSRGLSGSIREIIDDFKNIQGAQPARTLQTLGPTGQPIVTSGIPGVPQSMSFKDALTLRRKIDDAVDYVGQESMKVGKQEEAILKTIRRELNERLKNVSYKFREANDVAAETFENYRKLASDVLSGSEDTIQRKITNLFSKDTIERRLIEYTDESFTKASRKLDDVLDMITASKFSAKLNPSLERAFMHTGGGPAARAMQLGAAAALGGEAVAHGITGPAATGLAGAMAVTSPRLGIEAIYRGRQAYEALARPGVLPTLVSPAMLGEFQRIYDKLKANKYGFR